MENEANENDGMNSRPLLSGRAWCFGDNISTDLIMPGPQVLAENGGSRPSHLWCFEAVRPGWALHVEAGDIIVAGINFGCGSGRNGARLFKKLGISAVVAGSVARSFFRNAVNTALPVLTCDSALEIVAEGDLISVDIVAGRVANLDTGMVATGEPLPLESPPMQILLAGGFDKFVDLVRSGYDPRSGEPIPAASNETFDVAQNGEN